MHQVNRLFAANPAPTSTPALAASRSSERPDRPSGRRASILGMRVDELEYARVLPLIQDWARAGQSRTMCISTVHMVMEAYDDPQFQAVVNGADLVGADGVPIIHVSRWLGLSDQGRVFAPEMVRRLCRLAAATGLPVGFYGSTPTVLADLVARVTGDNPGLTVAYHHSPPFRTLHEDETAAIAEAINRSGARIVFVGLGCPRQERWMHMMRGRVNAVMLGVGWAFDVVAGHSHEAPRLIQRAGLEWFYRLVQNPRKLWRRHLRNNPRFILFVAQQLWRQRIRRV